MIDIQQIAHSLGKSTKGSDGWYSCICPAHNDKNPSLSIKESDNGKLIVKCYTGCSPKSIFQELENRGIYSRNSHNPNFHKSSPYNPNNNATEQSNKNALQQWENLLLEGQSDYLKKKGVKNYGFKYGKNGMGNFVAAPYYNIQGELCGYQRIYDNGEKKNLAGSSKTGCFHVIGKPPTKLKESKTIYITEGISTGASVYEALEEKETVICTMGCDNFNAVISRIKKAYPTMTIIIAGDDDQWSDDGNNAGRQKAEDAAKKYGCHVVFPKFQEDHYTSKPTDFNDLHCLEGLNEVKSQICNKIKKLVAVVAVSKKDNINQLLITATSSAPSGDVELHFPEEYIENDLKDKKNLFLVRDINDEVKKDLALLYSDHGLIDIAETNQDLSALPETIKEVIMISRSTSEEQQKKDRYANKLLQRKGIATHTHYFSEDDTLTEEQLKTLVNQCKQQLQIPSSLMRMTNAQDLFKYNTKENDFLIQGLIPAVGVSILGGHPKTGKSWMALNFIRCLSRNELVFNEFYSQQVGVYYLSLEDNTSRLKSRLQKIYEEDNPEVSNLEIKTHIGSSINGNYDFLDELRKEIESSPYIKFLIIDPFQKIRGANDRKSDAYQADYKDMSALKDLADEFEISILLIHHLKKDKNLSEACLSSLNGSMGLSGAADSILLLTKENDNYSLKVTGKDVEERTLVLTLDQESFIFSVAAEEQTMNKGVQDEILEILKNKGEPCQSKEIAGRLGRTDTSGQSYIRNQLTKLKNKGLIKSPKYGFYSFNSTKTATNSNLVAVGVAVKNSIKSIHSQPTATTATLNCFSEDEEYEYTEGGSL